MCYAKPGPRCSAHAKAVLDAAIAKHGADSKEAREAREAFLRTPAGIKELKQRGELGLAVKYEQERDRSIGDHYIVSSIKTYAETELMDEVLAYGDNYSPYGSTFDSGSMVVDKIEVYVDRAGKLNIDVTTKFNGDEDDLKSELIAPWNFGINPYSRYPDVDLYTDSDVDDWVEYSNRSASWDERRADIREAIYETFDGWFGFIKERVEQNVNVTVDMPEVKVETGDVRNAFADFLAQELEDLGEDGDDDDYEQIANHPLASSDTRRLALKRMAESRESERRLVESLDELDESSQRRLERLTKLCESEQRSLEY